MSVFETVEGHPIKVGECYQTREGKKAFISRLNDWCIRGNVAGQDYMEDWWHHGYRLKNQSPLNQDLMRPWPTEFDHIREATKKVIKEFVKIFEEENDGFAHMAEVHDSDEYQALKALVDDPVIKIKNKNISAQEYSQALKALIDDHIGGADKPMERPSFVEFALSKNPQLALTGESILIDIISNYIEEYLVGKNDKS